MSRVKEALTRKLGPLPAWAWLLIVGAGVWWYRNRNSSVSGTGTGNVSPTPVTPQDPVTLDPGQSVYNPNTGSLSTAPGGGTDNGTSGAGSGNDGGGGGSSNQTPEQVDSKPTIIQIIQGKKRRIKPKVNQGKGPSKTTKHTKPGEKQRPHGTAHVKNDSNRNKGTKPSAKGRARSSAVHITRTAKQGTLRIARSRPTTPAVKTTVRSHPPAVRPAHQDNAAVNPRPSAPPPRQAQRTVSTRPPAPRGRRRH